MRTNILRDFQICIIVPLIILKGFSVAKSCLRPKSVLLKLKLLKNLSLPNWKLKLTKLNYSNFPTIGLFVEALLCCFFWF